jgi:hypothetical protein
MTWTARSDVRTVVARYGMEETVLIRLAPKSAA